MGAKFLIHSKACWPSSEGRPRHMTKPVTTSLRYREAGAASGAAPNEDMKAARSETHNGARDPVHLYPDATKVAPTAVNQTGGVWGKLRSSGPPAPEAVHQITGMTSSGLIYFGYQVESVQLLDWSRYCWHRGVGTNMAAALGREPA